MRSIWFIAMLFCMGLAGLVSGGIALYENLDFRFNGRKAVMELADPARKLVLPQGGYDVHLVDVRYVGPAGDLVVPQKPLVGELARKLAAGGKVPLTYLKQNPYRVMYSDETLPNPWGWLLLGVAGMATFAWALKLKLREAAEA